MCLRWGYRKGLEKLYDCKELVSSILFVQQMWLDLFSNDCRKSFLDCLAKWFALKSRAIFSTSEKQKPNTIARDFPRALRKSQVMARNSDWLIALCYLVGLVLVFRQHLKIALYSLQRRRLNLEVTSSNRTRQYVFPGSFSRFWEPGGTNLRKFRFLMENVWDEQVRNAAPSSNGPRGTTHTL